MKLGNQISVAAKAKNVYFWQAGHWMKSKTEMLPFTSSNTVKLFKSKALSYRGGAESEHDIL